MFQTTNQTFSIPAVPMSGSAGEKMLERKKRACELRDENLLPEIPKKHNYQLVMTNIAMENPL